MGALDNLFFPRIDVNGERVIDSPRSFNFTGTNASVVDDPVNGRADIAVGGGASAPAYLTDIDSPAALWNFNGSLAAVVGGSTLDLTAAVGSVLYTDASPGLRGVIGGPSVLRLESTANVALSKHTGAITIELLGKFESESVSRTIVQAATSNTSTQSNTAWSVEVVTGTNLPLRWHVGQTFSTSRTVSKQTSNLPYYPFSMQYLAFTRTADGTTWKVYQNGRLIHTITGFTQPSGADVSDTGHKIVFGKNEQSVSGPMPNCVLASCRITTAEKTVSQILAAYNQCLGPMLGPLT